MPSIIFRKLRDEDVPAAGELWIRPAQPDHPLCRALAQLVLEQGVASLAQGAPPFDKIVVQGEGIQPTLDEMLAAYFAQRLLEGQVFSSPFQDFAKYAAILRQGKNPTKLSAEETLEGIYLAIRNRAGSDLTEPGAAARFLEGWQRLARRLDRAAAENADVFHHSLFAAGAEFAEEKTDLLEDHKRYLRDVSKGERWTIELPGTAKKDSGLLLRNPKSFRFRFYSRREEDTPTGEPYVLLVVFWGAGKWDISTDPAHDLPLTGLTDALQAAEDAGNPAARPAAEDAGPSTWYDGRHHRYTIVSSPRGGTRLDEDRVLGLVKQWTRARVFVPANPRSPKAVALRLAPFVALAGLFVVVLLFWRQAARTSEEVYRLVAPAVVKVETRDAKGEPFEHGTGFFVSADGWLVTNHHVIETARPELSSGAQQVTIHLGKMVDGRLQRLSQTVSALVYKSNPHKDLALLKLTQKPPGLAELPFLALAPADQPKISPGLRCWSIGNPMAVIDTFNRLHSGEVGQIGVTPKEIEVTAKIIHSSCQLEPGESGSPLVDQNGRLIGVAFSIPGKERGDTYHIHLEDVRAFLADLQKMPDAPPLYVPSSTPKFIEHKLSDLNGDALPDSIFYVGLNRARDKAIVTGVWTDLRNSNDETAGKDLLQRWKFHFALVVDPYPTAFYDSDGDNQIDLIVQGPSLEGESKGDLVWRLREEKWTLSQAQADRPILSAEWFTDSEFRARFGTYRRKIEFQLKQ